MSSSRTSTGDTLTSDRSLNKYSTLAAGRIGHRFLGSGTGAPQGEELGLMKPLSVPNDLNLTGRGGWYTRQVLRKGLQEILEQPGHLQFVSPLNCLRLGCGDIWQEYVDIPSLNTLVP
ncbi:hypothetical protein Tco_0954377 [Tanacetum coccineum]|uniref:Uncharacterized protein n=1 Tax=Tanacetum coccineum TaxID=301880 RepID=A0ABQ5E3S7_9ASTR